MKINNITFASFLFFVIFAFNSCSQGSSYGGQANPIPNNGIVVDSSVFFKVTFSGKTISVNQVYKDGNLLNYDAFVSMVSTNSNTGQTLTNLSIGVDGNSANGYHNTIYPNIPWQACAANLFTQRLGDVIGVYDYCIGTITDLSIGVGRKEYQIERDVNPSTFHLELTSIDARFIIGNFTCFLIDGSNRIPASGSFRQPYF
jgi:hypothetical protein